MEQKLEIGIVNIIINMPMAYFLNLDKSKNIRIFRY